MTPESKGILQDWWFGRDDRRSHRATRVEMYADWLAHDADGLASNLPPADPASIQGLRNARVKLREALRIVDQAIENCERAALAIELNTPAKEPAL